MAAQVFYCNIDPLRDAALYAHYAALVPEKQQEHLLTLRFPDDRLRSLAAGLMLHCALNHLQVPLHLRCVVRRPNGRPIFQDLPVHFSLSHSGTVAMCAISDAAVGADVQRLHAPSDALIARVCTAEERTWLASQADSDGAFTALWTRKESLLKMLDRTISEDLRSFPCLDKDQNDWHFFERTLFGLPACVCTAEEPTWSEMDLTSEEIQNSFHSWT